MSAISPAIFDCTAVEVFRDASDAGRDRVAQDGLVAVHAAAAEIRRDLGRSLRAGIGDAGGERFPPDG